MVTTPARGDTSWDVSLNAALNDLQTQIDGKVAKAGDTITGAVNASSNGAGATLAVSSTADGAANVGVLVVNPSTTAKRAVDIRLSGDSVSRLRVDMSAGTGSGTLTFGNGTAADVNLYRSAADTLKTDDTFVIGTGTLNLGASVNLYAATTNIQTDNYLVVPSGQSSGQWNVFGGAANSLNLGTAGGGIAIKAGSNARLGTATLVAGTVTVANTSVTANTKIFLSRATTGGTPGHLSYTKINGTSFTINATGGADTSTVDWLLVEAS